VRGITDGQRGVSRRALSWALFPIAVLATALLLGLGTEAQARPGGGHSYSGGGSSGGGSSGGGYSGGSRSSSSGGFGSRSGSRGGKTSPLEVAVMLVVIVLVIGFQLLQHFLGVRQRGWSNAPPIRQRSRPPRQRRAANWAGLRKIDAGFSAVMFEDFCYALYARVHMARGDDGLRPLAPYLDEKARQFLRGHAETTGEVKSVIVGSMSVDAMVVPDRLPGEVRAKLRFEANLGVVRDGREGARYVEEVWSLRRDARVQSRPPQPGGHAFGCPNCGAPFDGDDPDTCGSCGEGVAGGRFDWVVDRISRVRSKAVPPNLTGHAPEVGTDNVTRVQSGLKRKLRQLEEDDPSFSLGTIEHRLQLIFSKLNEGWVGMDLSPTRPFVSDKIHDYLSYWIRAYRQSNLRNVVEDARFLRWDPVKVVRDQHYDALTVRFWASCVDFTEDANGRLVGGSKRKRRRYSEYWTLIRGAGVRGEPPADANCPNCGAGLEVNQAGHCEHCDSHVTRGEFDWVLSKIEQDESYRG
jgi:Tim44-like domain